MFSLVLVAGGLVILGFSGDRLVDFAVTLARRIRLSPAVIALTVVAIGTSLPELAVSVTASIEGSSGIALGNVIGSNIANLGLVLGAMAAVAPAAVRPAAIRLEYPIMLLSFALIYLLSRDRMIDRPESAFLLIFLLAFVAFSVWLARRQFSRAERSEITETVKEEASRYERQPVWFLVLGLSATFLGLALGSELLVRGASQLAAAAGVSDRIVGLTVVAIGTSAPELVASIAAAVKKQHEMAIMNVVGSNIFNSLGIVGVAGAVSPLAVDSTFIAVDLSALSGIALLASVLALDRKLSRIDGWALLASYAAYLVYLVYIGLSQAA